MKIIKQAIEFPEKHIVCTHCKSELLYDDRDIHTAHQEWSHELYIICPVCGKRIVLQTISEGC